MSTYQTDFHSFCVVGVNHRDTPIDSRERFSLSHGRKKALIEGARREGIDSLLVISTCNRTEVFARDTTPQMLIQLLISCSEATLGEFDTYGFEMEGPEATEHLFEVACGLDSQILGDLQIIKQVKEAYELAVEMDAVESELHRLMQHVFRAHKRSRSETSLGKGSATTAYAAVCFAQQTFQDIASKEILLIGTGKIGHITCKNLASLGAANVTVMNRTAERARCIADRLNLSVADMAELPEQIAAADLVIAATSAPEPVITMGDMKPAIESEHDKVLLDLSVPRNIAPEVGTLSFVQLANMDYFADVTDEAAQKREESIPLVKEIIEDELLDYQTWLSTRQVVPTIKALTQKFEGIREKELGFFEHKIKQTDRDKVENLTRRIVNKIAAYSIEHLRDHHESQEIQQMVNDMFELETTAGHD